MPPSFTFTLSHCVPTHYTHTQFHSKNCELVTIDCPHTCGFNCQRKELSSHLLTCPNKPQQCPTCSIFLPKNKRSDHAPYCSKIMLPELVQRNLFEVGIWVPVGSRVEEWLSYDSCVIFIWQSHCWVLSQQHLSVWVMWCVRGGHLDIRKGNSYENRRTENWREVEEIGGGWKDQSKSTGAKELVVLFPLISQYTSDMFLLSPTG